MNVGLQSVNHFRVTFTCVCSNHPKFQTLIFP